MRAQLYIVAHHVWQQAGQGRAVSTIPPPVRSVQQMLTQDGVRCWWALLLDQPDPAWVQQQPSALCNLSCGSMLSCISYNMFASELGSLVFFDEQVYRPGM
jgi:hypothetical protein